MALPARAVDQRLEPGGGPVACLVGALLPEVGMVDDVGQAAVSGLEPQTSPDSSSAWPRGSATSTSTTSPPSRRWRSRLTRMAYGRPDGAVTAGWSASDTPRPLRSGWVSACPGGRR